MKEPTGCQVLFGTLVPYGRCESNDQVSIESGMGDHEGLRVMGWRVACKSRQSAENEDEYDSDSEEADGDKILRSS